MATSCPITMASNLREAPPLRSGVAAWNRHRSMNAPLEMEASLQRIGASTAAFATEGQRHPALTISLHCRQLVGLDDCIGVEIHLRSGQLWITQADDYRDIVMQSGELFRLDRKGLALVTATQPSVLSLTPADAGILSRLRFE